MHSENCLIPMYIHCFKLRPDMLLTRLFSTDPVVHLMRIALEKGERNGDRRAGARQRDGGKGRGAESTDRGMVDGESRHAEGRGRAHGL